MCGTKCGTKCNHLFLRNADMGKLTSREVDSFKEPGRYTDGDGLMLFIDKQGSRRWVLRVQTNGRRRDIGLGGLKKVPLKRARKKAQDIRDIIEEGRDPVAERRKQNNPPPTFENAAQQVFKENTPAWRNDKHAAQWLSSLKKYAFPKLGQILVSDIDAASIRNVLAEIWLSKPETARRVRQRIAAVLDYAHAMGWRSTEAPMRAISKGLPKQPHRKVHHTSMPWRDLPDFVAGMSKRLRSSDTVLLAIEFVILTAARSGEVRLMTWAEISGNCWTVPANRMKANREHRVPLSQRCVEILDYMQAVRRTQDPSALVFEGTRQGRPISDMTLLMPLRRAEINSTIHGFRSSFRNWCSEATNTPREVAEAALAHAVGGVEGAYARTDHYERRVTLMERWAAFVTGEKNVVVPITSTG